MLKAPLALALGLLASSAVLAAEAPMTAKGSMTPGKELKASSMAAAQAASAEGERVARLKQQILDKEGQQPVLDKLGPYLGKDY